MYYQMMLHISQRQEPLTDYLLWSDYPGFLISASDEKWKTLLICHLVDFFVYFCVLYIFSKLPVGVKLTHCCSIVANKMQAIALPVNL
jgi:hypothetical protein